MRKLVFTLISSLALCLGVFTTVSARNGVAYPAQIPPDCARSGNNATNPDTGGGAKADYQYVSTDASGIVVEVSFTTLTSFPAGGNRWSNNGAWGNVVVGGKIVSDGGNYYYPPGCEGSTPTSVPTTSPATNTEVPAVPATAPPPALATNTAVPVVTNTIPVENTNTQTPTPGPTATTPPQSCARSGNNGTNPDTGGALKGDYQYVSTDALGNVVAVSFTTPTNFPFGGNRWSNNGAWGNVVVGGKIISAGGNYYYPPGCEAPTSAPTAIVGNAPATTIATTGPASTAVPTQKIIVAPAKTAAPPPVCARSGNNGTNPDTGGALKGDYQYVSTDALGNVVAVSFTTPTNFPFGGNRWSNNGAWGNVVVGGKIISAGGNYYYPPGCEAPTSAPIANVGKAPATNIATTTPRITAVGTQKLTVLPATSATGTRGTIVAPAVSTAISTQPIRASSTIVQTAVSTPSPAINPNANDSEFSSTVDGGVNVRPKRRLPIGYQQAI